MKTRLIFPTIALSLLLAACVAPFPAPPARVQLPGSEKAQLPLQLPTAPVRQSEPTVIWVSALPAGEIADFGQTRTAGEQKYAQPRPELMLPAGEIADFGQTRTAGERQTYPAQIGRTDPSAYPAEIERIVNSTPLWATDPSAYPAEIEQLMVNRMSYATDPSAYPAEIQRIAAP